MAPREQVPLVSSVRGTVIIASLRGLKRAGLEARYLAALGRRHHDVVTSITAGVWLPVEFAIAHYEACEALALDRKTIDAIGAESGRIINETFLTVLTKLSKESGASPTFAVSYCNKLMARTWRGSSMAGWKIGPKDARIEWIQQPLARIPYFRAAFGSFSQAICKMFASTLYVRELPQRASHPNEVGYRISWV
jgi:hypothetical protein